MSKTVNKHIEDGTYRNDRHGEKKKSLDSFDLLDKLPTYKGNLLNKIGKKYYNEYGKVLIKQKLLCSVDLPLLEEVSYLYQYITETLLYCKGNITEFLIENKITVQSAFYHNYKNVLTDYKDILKSFGASPIEREKITKQTEELHNPFMELV